jgi:hypothetical protein
MQSKIIFLVLFMLSFTVMHDTVINLLDNNDNVPVTQYANADGQTQDIADIHDMHEIFHFIALATPLTAPEVALENGDILSVYLLQYTLPHFLSSNKPPIV